MHTNTKVQIHKFVSENGGTHGYSSALQSSEALLSRCSTPCTLHYVGVQLLCRGRYLFSVKCHKSFSFTRLPQHIPPSYFKSGQNAIGCFHIFTTTLSCLNDQMLLLIMDGQDCQEQGIYCIVQVTIVQLYESSFILVL